MPEHLLSELVGADRLWALAWEAVNLLLVYAAWRWSRWAAPDDPPAALLLHTTILGWAAVVLAATVLGIAGGLTATALLGAIAAPALLALGWLSRQPAGPARTPAPA